MKPAAVIRQALDSEIRTRLDAKLWRQREIEMERASCCDTTIAPLTGALLPNHGGQARCVVLRPQTHPLRLHAGRRHQKHQERRSACTCAPLRPGGKTPTTAFGRGVVAGTRVLAKRTTWRTT